MLSETTVVLADDHAILRDGLKMVLEAQPGIAVVGKLMMAARRSIWWSGFIPMWW